VVLSTRANPRQTLHAYPPNYHGEPPRALPLEVRHMLLCSIQAYRHPPIDIFLVDLPVLDCGGGQLP
jgi:hypothetical protein